jgi:ERCC4-type nuclease
MKLPLSEVPGISEALIWRIHQDTKIRSVSDVVISQNASSELQKANYVGPRRAENIIKKVELTVEEFLS